MKILEKLLSPGPEVYYSEAFRRVLEDHMTYLRMHSDTTLLTVESFTAYKHRGDLFRVLQSYNVPGYMHWTIMRMNNLTSPSDFKETTVSLLIPATGVLERMRSTHLSQSKLKK